MSLEEIDAKLPSPHSHLSQTVAIAGNNDGDLVRSTCLLGGCRAPYTSSMLTAAGIDENGSKVAQYTCTDISDSNLVLSPGNEGYDIEENTPMPRPRYRHSSVTANGKIWIIGGRDEKDDIVNEIDIYDEIHDQWFTIEGGLDTIKLPDEVDNKYGVSDHCAFAFGENIFIVGGFDQSYRSVGHMIAIEAIKSIEQNRIVYAIRSSMNVPRGACGVTTIGDYAMVAGGFTSEDGYCEAMKSTEIYDVKKDSWVLSKAPLKYGRARPSLVYLDSQVFAFGGEKRGLFDSTSGHCEADLSLGKRKANRIENNKTLPNRLSYPIESAEVMTIEEDMYSSRWRVLQKKFGNGRYMYATSTDPSTSSIYFIGGIINHITKDKSQIDSCPGCFVISDQILVYDTRKGYDELEWMETVLIVAPCLGAVMCLIVFLRRKLKRRKTKNEDSHDDVEIRFTDHSGGDLMTGQLIWRGESTVI